MEKKLNHLAIILDGNGRWANLQKQPRKFGHEVGFNKIEQLCEDVIDEKIKYLTLYCFSTENWNRPKEEVDFLFTRFINMVKKFKKQAIKNKIRVRWIGRKDRFDQKLVSQYNELEKLTSEFEPILNLNLCIDYGSINEISSAIKGIFDSYKNKVEFEEKFKEEDIYKYLYTSGLPNIDLLIRPGKEKRLSNFMLLQAAYSELYFCDWYWPEYDKQKLEVAILDYNNRNRRFGKIDHE